MSVFHWQFLIICIFCVSVSLKFGAFRVQEGKFRIENTTSCLYKHFWHFVIVVAVAVVVVFHQNICVFIIFIFFNFFFWWSIQFSQQSVNQSETGIGDKKLSVKLSVMKWIKRCHNINWETNLLDIQNRSHITHIDNLNMCLS